MKTRTRAGTFALGLSLAACSTPMQPTVTPDHASVERIDMHGVALAVALDVTSTMSTDISIREITAHVVLDGRIDVGKVAMKRNIPLPAHMATRVSVPISVAWKDVAPLILLGASDRPVPYAVDGSVSIGGEAVHFDVPYHVAGSIPHAEIVRATKRSLPGASSD